LNKCGLARCFKAALTLAQTFMIKIQWKEVADLLSEKIHTTSTFLE
jgi:hypothetical protein